jgi:2-dehydropantoate 2-reductase
MKILVYGAGVLGSYLAHVLLRCGNDVTLLARGKRLQELKENGLVIRHYMQLRTTVDKVKLTEHFDKNDAYDYCFCSCTRSHSITFCPNCVKTMSAYFMYW